MSVMEVLSITASLFSVLLALFAIWLSFSQRKESATNYDNTKTVLSDITKVMEKTELLVSENFQNLLKSITDQQRQMLESLKPRATQEEKYADLFVKLADEPEKLEKVTETMAKFMQYQHKQQPTDPLSLLLQLGLIGQQQKDK